MKKWIYFLVICLFLPLKCFAQSSQPLPIDAAFQFAVKSEKAGLLQLQWQIAPGYHLYRDRFQFRALEPQKLEVGQVSLPPGIPMSDAILGDYQVYKNILNLRVPVTLKSSVQNPAGDAIVLVTYQGCSEKNFCYPPITKRITFNSLDLTQLRVATRENAGNYHTLQEKVTQLLQERNYFLICLAFIGLGLLLAFTPCVLPMIPILSSIIVGQHRKDLTTRRAFFLSLSYVLGMSIAYAIAGVLVAMLGGHLSEAFQAPWVIVAFSALFIFLAFSLFGFYELKLPHFIHSRILHLSNKQKSGSYVGTLVMGALSVLIVSPCVTAPLVGILTFIAHTGSVVLGSVALFALGLGMGLPLLVIGTTEGKFLPKSGYWMNTVKSFFGVLLIGVAIYLLQRIVPGSIALMLWATLLIILAVYLGVGTYHRSVSSGWVKFGKGIGLLFFCYGVILLVGGAMGNKDVLYPLRITHTGTSSTNNESEGLSFQSVKSLSEIQQALMSARQKNQPVMLDFYADWCVACHEMDRTTFSDPKVKFALQNAMLLRVDVTANDANSQAIQRYYNVIAPPSMLFFDASGKELADFRVIGSMSSPDFLQHLQAISFN